MFKENKWLFLQLLGIGVGMVLLLVFAIQADNEFFEGGSGFNFSLDALLGEGNINSGFRSPPRLSIEYTKDYTAEIETNFGTITIDLFEKGAVMTVNNFVFLAEKNFYDGVYFHRLIPDSLIQGGDRNTLNNKSDDDGFGGPGYEFEDEINWNVLNYSDSKREQLTSEGYTSSELALQSRPLAKYRIAMANKGTPNTNGSQFFIILDDFDGIGDLEGKHTVFGEVINGFEVLEMINNIEIDSSDPDFPKPAKEILIKEVTIFVGE